MKDPVLKAICPPRMALPLTARRLLEFPLSRILRVPPVMLRLPTESIPTETPSPGVIAPPVTVRGELVATPVPVKTPPFTVMAPLPVFVPLS